MYDLFNLCLKWDMRLKYIGGRMVFAGLLKIKGGNKCINRKLCLSLRSHIDRNIN
jgi:hypothetical protein